jgi:hypothetical protein
MNMLDHFEKIIGAMGNKGLNAEFFTRAKDHLDAVAGVLGISQTQAVLFALILNHSGNEHVSIDTLASSLKCGKIKLLKYLDDFEALEKKRLIRAGRGQYLSFLPNNNGSVFPSYMIPLEVIKAVRQGVEYKCTDYENLSPEGFFDAAGDLLNASREDDITLAYLIAELNTLVEHNKDRAFTQKKKEYDLGEGSMIIMFLFCCKLIHEDEDCITTADIRQILGRGEARNVEHRFKSREHKLLVKGLVEYDNNMGLADTEKYRLTERARQEFLADVDIKEKTKHRGKEFIRAEDIQAKKLFFPGKIAAPIEELTSLLREENFRNIQKRLLEKNMRSGFACIFSGPPGTGKTESVYQIARETGRDIMLVDISETKSMWFGESEKRIKAVFDRYRGVVKHSLSAPGTLTPILLFNEADAVLGKRRELRGSRNGPEQTENAIQNIILQEMEELNGILFATTNMTCNLDKAFERRFLYKIEFEKPDMKAKKAIWQSIIPTLSGEDAAVLSTKFDFSGGQIENIARKQMVSAILTGITPALQDIIKLCENELLEKEHVKPIGFLLNP